MSSSRRFVSRLSRRTAGSWWIPGTDPEDSEKWEPLDARDHFQVHGIIPHGDRAYVSEIVFR